MEHDYILRARNFWEFQVTDDNSGATKWQRYNVKVQEHLNEQLNKNNRLTSLKFEAHVFMFDHENGNHRHCDVIPGAECAMRQTPEVFVDDWNVLMEMSDATIRNITILRLIGIHDKDELVCLPLNQFKSLWCLVLNVSNIGEQTGIAIGETLTTNASIEILEHCSTNLSDLAGVAIAKALTTNTTLTQLHLVNNYLGDRTGVAIAKALTTNTTLEILTLRYNDLNEESGFALVDALAQNSTLVELDLFGNHISATTQAKINFELSPELKGLLTNPSVSPSRVPVCVVGFDNVGKTELVNTWYRTMVHAFPRFDSEERAAALPDDERDKTSGISIKSFALPYKRKGRWSRASVNIAAWDFAGHPEYYVSHEVMMQACRDAVFVALLRIDRVHPVTQRNAETERLFFWLKFIATACVKQSQRPTVFIGGSFRPDNDVYDVEATTAWTDRVLRKAKDEFGDVLNLPQHSIYHMDCRKSTDPQVVELRNALAQVAEETRTQEDRKVPQICESVRTLLQQVNNEITSKLASPEKATRTRQSNVRATPLSWQDTEYAPIMTRADFEERVLGKLDFTAFSIGPFASKKLFQIITSYLHDVGDILWFDTDGLRDVVILTPDLFCSKIIGAIFRPDAPGFSVETVHRGGGLVPKSDIAATFKRVLGISDAHVDAALAVLCQLGLSHQHQNTTTGETSYLFPGALSATSHRHPEWFGPLPSGQQFIVGRRFTLMDPIKTLFSPGCMSQIQVWVLGQYEGSLIWRDGVIIPYSATQTLAEAGVQLHRPYSSSQGGDKCAQVSMSSITVIVRGSDAQAKNDCLGLLAELCHQIRTTSGTQLVEEALPPSELAQWASNKETNTLDVSFPGYDISTTNDDNDTDDVVVVVVGGKRHTIDTLRHGAYVQVSEALTTIPCPPEWVGDDFSPMNAQRTHVGAHVTSEIDHGSPEFVRIEKNMHRSLPNAKITRIVRVQNKNLWSHFFIARAAIEKSEELTGENPLEIEAWHSTGDTDPSLIYCDWKVGFDVNRSIVEIEYERDADGNITTTLFHKANKKSYGTGVYLAEHAIYPDTIFPHTRRSTAFRDAGKKQILLTKVVVGNMKDHGSEIPNLRAAIEPEGYHSISGTENDMKFLLNRKAKLVAQNKWTAAHDQLLAKGGEYGRQYVVHRSNQVYPAYVVTYETEKGFVPNEDLNEAVVRQTFI